MSSKMTIKRWFRQFEESTQQKVTHVQMYTPDSWDWEYKCYQVNPDGDYPLGSGEKDDEKWNGIASRNTLFRIDEVPKELLNYEFNDGFGAAEAPPIIAWSRDYVLYIHEYDGAETLRWIPRYPGLSITNPV